MAVTMKEIAEAAGVSRGTVDRVLHNRGGVRPEVARRVRRIAAEKGYLPNRAGQMLAVRKQPMTLGFVLPARGNVFFEEVKEGIAMGQKEMKDFGLRTIVKDVRGFYPDAHIKAIDQIMKKDINALCVTSADTPEIRAKINEIIDAGTPVVTLNTDLSSTKRVCYVGTDYVVGGRTAAGLLTLCNLPGTLKLLVGTGSLEVKGQNERLYGFNEILYEKKLPHVVLDIYETEDDDEIAYEKTKELLELHPDVNCIFNAAAGVMGIGRALEELEPERRDSIRFICFDDHEPVKKYIRNGTIDFVIGQEPVQQGYQAVIKLFYYLLSGGKDTMDDYITDSVIKIKENL